MLCNSVSRCSKKYIDRKEVDTGSGLQIARYYPQRDLPVLFLRNFKQDGRCPNHYDACIYVICKHLASLVILSTRFLDYLAVMNVVPKHNCEFVVRKVDSVYLCVGLKWLS